MNYIIIILASSLTQFFIQVYCPGLEKYIHMYMSPYTACNVILRTILDYSPKQCDLQLFKKKKKPTRGLGVEQFLCVVVSSGCAS